VFPPMADRCAHPGVQADPLSARARILFHAMAVGVVLRAGATLGAGDG
jgi:hypothetical protein